MDKPTGPTGPTIGTSVREAVEQVKEVVENADVEDVETPTGRKNVSVEWEDENGVHYREGQAIAVYRDTRTTYKIDWSEGDRTTVTDEQLIELDEGPWYTVDDNE